MKHKTIGMMALALAAVALTGCRDEGAQVIQMDRSITTVEGIDIQDFRGAAATLTREMMTDARFAATMQRIKTAQPSDPPLVKIMRIKNDTMLKIEMRDWLVEPMESELRKMGTLDFVADQDQGTNTMAGMNELLSGTGPRMPDLTLYGAVRDLRSEAGSMKQATYVFHLKAADRTGKVVWEGEKMIIKQGKRPSVGL